MIGMKYESPVLFKEISKWHGSKITKEVVKQKSNSVHRFLEKLSKAEISAKRKSSGCYK